MPMYPVHIYFFFNLTEHTAKSPVVLPFFLFFFLNDPAPPEIYPFPLPAPLPIGAGANKTAGDTDIARRSPAPSGIASKVRIPIRNVRTFIAFLAILRRRLASGCILAVQVVDHLGIEKNWRRLRYAEGSVGAKARVQG